MKQRVLALAIKRIVWAELALTAVLAPPAFAQSQPAPVRPGWYTQLALPPLKRVLISGVAG